MITGDGHPLSQGNPNRRKKIGEGLLIHPEKDLPSVGEQEGNTDRGDQHGQLGLIPQGTVSEQLDQYAKNRADQHGPEQDSSRGHPRIGQEVMDPGSRVEAGKGADHQNIAVSEVDKLQEAVNHAVAECDQGIDHPKGETIDQLLKELMHWEGG